MKLIVNFDICCGLKNILLYFLYYCNYVLNELEIELKASIFKFSNLF